MTGGDHVSVREGVGPMWQREREAGHLIAGPHSHNVTARQGGAPRRQNQIPKPAQGVK
jgi:hypothetical protein